MKVSRTVSYALRATLQLAETNSPKPVPCSRLAADGGMPERFLLQILRSLVNHGILQSTRGVDGGYTLSRPAADISLLEVMEAVEGPVDARLPEPPPEVTIVHQERLEAALKTVGSSLREQLAAIKISQV